MRLRLRLRCAVGIGDLATSQSGGEIGGRGVLEAVLCEQLQQPRAVEAERLVDAARVQHRPQLCRRQVLDRAWATPLSFALLLLLLLKELLLLRQLLLPRLLLGLRLPLRLPLRLLHLLLIRLVFLVVKRQAVPSEVVGLLRLIHPHIVPDPPDAPVVLLLVFRRRLVSGVLAAIVAGCRTILRASLGRLLLLRYKLELPRAWQSTARTARLAEVAGLGIPHVVDVVGCTDDGACVREAPDQCLEARARAEEAARWHGAVYSRDRGRR